jgi:hypothetical protein
MHKGKGEIGEIRYGVIYKYCSRPSNVVQEVEHLINKELELIDCVRYGQADY